MPRSRAGVERVGCREREREGERAREREREGEGMPGGECGARGLLLLYYSQA